MVWTRLSSIACAIAVAALLASPPLVAHDLWIAPSSFTPALGAPIRLQLVLADGERIETVPRNDAGIVRFAARGPGGDQPVAGLDGVAPAGFLRPSTPGWYTILYESSPSFTSLSEETFRDYLLEKGLDPAARPLPAAQPSAIGAEAAEPEPVATTTEIFRRSIKARVLVGAPGGAAPADPGEEKPVGLPFELLLERAALADDRAEREIVIRVLLEGAPLAGAKVDLRRLDDTGSGAHEENRKALALTIRQASRSNRIAASDTTDDEGRVHVRLSPGSWVATSVHLDPSRPATAADWESVWSSLTFHLD